MNALQWINDLAQWVGRLFPRLTLVPPTHAGVMFGPRGGVTFVGCGLVLWWPIAQKLTEVDITIGSMDIAAIAVPTSDAGLIPRVSIIGMVARWQITDPALLAVKTLDAKRLIDNTCQATIGRHCVDGVAISAAFDEIKVDLRVFGIELLSLHQSHAGQAVAILQVAEWTNTEI